MKRTPLWLALALCPAAFAGPSGGSYSITRTSIDGGGGRLQASGYVLDASVGQPDTQRLAGGTFSVSGGFWNEDGVALDRIFADGFE